MADESKVLVIGLGSVGLRHIRSLSDMRQPNVIRLTRKGPGETIPGLSTKIVHSWEAALAEVPQFAIIANPTAYHLETASRLAHSGIPFIIEKPVSDKIEGLSQLQNTVRTKKLPVMVGFQLRHHPGYLKFIDLIDSGAIGRPMNLQGSVGQYLPEWRPGVDYRCIYSAERDMGGGVIFDLCHEIDIAIAAMGPVSRVHCVSGRYSDLEIDSEDVAEIILEHQSHKVSHIHLNYLEPKYCWTTSVLGTHGKVTWDYGKGFVSLVCREGISESWQDPVGFERNDLFHSQMQQWLDVLAGRGAPAVDLDAGVAVTKVAIAAHESAASGRGVLV